MKFAAACLGLATTVLAAARTSAPSGCSTVSASGGDYKTIQAAVDAASKGGCIFINKGTYTEQVLVTTESLTIYGYSTDTSSYTGNGAILTYGLSQDDVATNDLTGTLRVKGANFKLYNLDVVNSRGKGSQAIAVSAYADSGYYGCSLQGFQDTLLTQLGNQLYSNCEIVGATDFIFGQKSFAWFENCDIRVVTATTGYITANGAATPGASKYVFNGCDIAVQTGNTVPASAFYLGRPWADDAYVVFQKSTISNVINAAGWLQWSAATPRTEGVTFAVYGNTGAGAASNSYSAPFATKLSSAIAIKDILGSSYTSAGYYDASYM